MNDKCDIKKSLIKEKSYQFALDSIELYKVLIKQNEHIMSRQLLKSGTSIGANVEEALAGQSRADFLSKMSIASKESRESNYWLRLLRDSNIFTGKLLGELLEDSDEIVRILTSIVKTTSRDTKK